MHQTSQKIGTSLVTQIIAPCSNINFNLITSFIQESADKHISSKNSRSTSSVTYLSKEKLTLIM